MLDVLYEDNHLIAVNKKPGDIIQSDKTGDTPLSSYVKKYIKKKYKKPGEVFLGTIHRLDRPTSGVVLFARTSKALSRMNKQFQERNVKKLYLAIVNKYPEFEQGKLENYLRKNQKQNKSYITNENQGKKAVLRYKVIKELNNYFLLEIIPETGRHHQIRVQLSNIGSIIKGDLKYGAKRSNNDASIHLHAYKLIFHHPVTKILTTIEAKPPIDPIWNNC